LPIIKPREEIYMSTKKKPSPSNRLPTVPVHDLVDHPRGDGLVIGTHGRRCFILDVKPIREQAKELLD
jgi:hypothetical protein